MKSKAYIAAYLISGLATGALAVVGTFGLIHGDGLIKKVLGWICFAVLFAHMYFLISNIECLQGKGGK